MTGCVLFGFPSAAESRDTMRNLSIRSSVCLVICLLSSIGCQQGQSELSFRRIANEIVSTAKAGHEHAVTDRNSAAIKAEGQKIVELFQSLPKDTPDSLSDAKHALATIGPAFEAVANHLTEEATHRGAATTASAAAEEKKGEDAAKEFEAAAADELKSADRERKMADRMIEQLPKQIRTAERLLSNGK